jgi:hypothetical protein
MDINPYESPRPGESVVEHGVGNADPIVRLLIEIRDAQREALDLQREALQRAPFGRRFFFLRTAIPFVIIVASYIFVTRLIRYTATPPVPATRATPVFPSPPPSPPPASFR